MKQCGTVGVSLLALAMSLSSSAAEDLIGFWDFKGGMDGDSVLQVSSSAGSSEWIGTAYKAGGNSGEYPTFSSACPASVVYADASCSEVLCVHPKSLHFALVNGTGVGGYVDIAGLSTELSGHAAFTVEFFARLDNDANNPWTVPLCFQTDGYHVTPIFGQGNAVSMRFSYLTTEAAGIKTVGQTEVYTTSLKGIWRHVAMVFSETDETTHAGDLKCYLDRHLVGTIAYTNTPTASDLPLRLGTSVGYNRVAHTSYNFRGDICALRVTASIREPETMMFIKDYDVPDGEMLGFWDFKDGAVGTDATSLVNQGAMASLGNGVGSALTDLNTDKGCVPRFDVDAPGTRIYASSVHSDDNVLVDRPQSLKFTTEGEPTSQSQPFNSVGGGLVTFPGVGSALSSQANYTIECFFKNEDWSEWQWQTGLFGFLSNTNGAPYSNQAMVSSVKSDKRAWDVQALGVTVSRNRTWKDGLWHHLALVYNGAAKTASLYVDYESVGSAAYVNEYRPSSDFFLGTRADKRSTYAFRGKVACLRMMPRPLAPTEFMSAGNDDVDTVFHWDFENGASRVGQAVQNPTDSTIPNQHYSFGWGYNVLGSSLPTFDALPGSGKLVQADGHVVGTNRTSVLFHGVHSITDVERQSQTSILKYSGTVFRRAGSSCLDQNPTNWTMEAFIRMQYEYDLATWPNMSVHLFGKAGNEKVNQKLDGKNYNWTPTTCWALYLTGGRQFGLTWTENDGSINATTSEDGTGGVAKSKTFDGTAALYDMKWHHVAVTYNATNRQFELFVDYKSLGTAQTGTVGPLWDGPFEYEFSRGVGGQGFEGWMDEIRFSRAVRTPESFLRELPSGTLLIFR